MWQVVYRTLGYSGADIRNLINEAGIMAVSLFYESLHAVVVWEPW